MVARGALLLAMLAGCGAASRARPASPDAEREVRAVAADYVDGYFQMFPEQARQAGLADPRFDTSLSDRSPASLRRWQAREDAWLARIRSIDSRRLEGRPEWATQQIVREQLETSVARRACRDELWGVRQVYGWQENLAFVAAGQPVGSPEARRRLLARWRELPRLLSTEVQNLREGLRLGYRAPRGNLRRVLAQMDALIKDPTSSYLFEPARRDGDPVLARTVGELITR